MAYTLTQFTAFLKAEHRLERERARVQMSLMAVACQGDRKTMERMERELAHED